MIRCIHNLALLLLLAVPLSAQQKSRYVVPIGNDVPVYAHQIRQVYEKPAFVLNEGSALAVLERTSEKTKVRDENGRTGWIENMLLRSVSKTFIYEPQAIEDRLDNPEKIWLIDPGVPENEPIRLDRSFKDEARVNEDKESMERSCSN
jgi:hypothetical protein